MNFTHRVYVEYHYDNSNIRKIRKACYEFAIIIAIRVKS